MALRVGSWVTAAAALVACAPAIPTLPSQGGPAWVEVKSEHITLWTNASAERGREIVRQLERRRQVVMDAMNRATSKAGVFVIALRDLQQVQVYTGVGFGGFAWPADNPTAQPGILMAADARDVALSVTHELAHVFSFEIIPRQPRWLAEGIASYFETADFDSDDTSVEIGRPRDGFGRILGRGHLRSVADLFGCKGNCVDTVYYATSWVLFSFLVNEHYERLGRYLQRLNELPREKHVQAWREVFPDLPPAELDHKLSRWVQLGDVRLPRVPVTVRDGPATERALGDADVLAARSLIAAAGGGDIAKRPAAEVAAIRADARAALAIDRTHLIARLIEAEVTHSISPDDARAVAAAHPDDWRAWRLVERALRGTPEANAARERLCALAEGAAPECADDGRRPDAASR